MEILNAYRPKKIFDKDICCDYRVKEDISDTLVEVIREFLIVNYQSKIASGLCGNYQKILYCWRKKDFSWMTCWYERSDMVNYRPVRGFYYMSSLYDLLFGAELNKICCINHKDPWTRKSFKYSDWQRSRNNSSMLEVFWLLGNNHMLQLISVKFAIWDIRDGNAMPIWGHFNLLQVVIRNE